MDFSQCQTPPPMSSPNLMFPSNYNNSYSMDGGLMRSMSVSDDDIASRHNDNKDKDKDNNDNNINDNNNNNGNIALIFNQKRGKLKINTMDPLSDTPTFDDEYGTDSDYLSSPRGEKQNDFRKNLTLKLPQQDKKKKKDKKQRARAFSSTEKSDKYLKLPIVESDDNYDEDIGDRKEQKLNLPKISTKLHLRSFSESNIHRDIQNNQWPSSDDSDDTFKDEPELNDISNQQKIKQRYVSMKRKYKKQRRISQQFQNAITVIQDDNEDNIIATENQLRDQLEKEYELKLIQLEHQKLNMNIHNDDKMKQILSQNEELMLQNKQLQQQVAAQVKSHYNIYKIKYKYNYTK